MWEKVYIWKQISDARAFTKINKLIAFVLGSIGIFTIVVVVAAVLLLYCAAALYFAKYKIKVAALLQYLFITIIPENFAQAKK